MSQNQVRVVRVLIYTGSRETVQHALYQRSIQGTTFLGDLCIDEVAIGDFTLEELVNTLESSLEDETK
jgi:hypothetical protein